MTSKELSYRSIFYSYLGILVLLIILLLSSCCTIGQIPTQFYFANDSCTFHISDYTEAIEARDNCCIDYYRQTPTPGSILIPGVDTRVTIEAADCYGNYSSMSFDVVIIDTIPPTFYYDSAQFIPTGHYQTDSITYSLYTVIDTDEGRIIHYYRTDQDAVPIATNIYDDFIGVSHFDSPSDWRAQIFKPQSKFKLTSVRLKMYTTGSPEVAVVEVKQLGADQNPEAEVLSVGYFDAAHIYPDTTGIGAWYKIKMRDCILSPGMSYIVQLRGRAVDADNRLEWKISSDKYPNGFALWSNDAGVTTYWNRSLSRDYLFEIWGVKVNT